MKRLPLVLALALTASGAFAQAAQQSLAMTCQAVRQVIASRGAAVIYTEPSAYDRYVSSSQFCAYDEGVEPATIATADTPRCFVGYRCRASDLVTRTD